MFRSGNPALKENTFLDAASGTVVTRDGEAMTINGTVHKTGLLLFLAVLTGAFAWNNMQFDASGAPVNGLLYLGVGVIGGLVFSLATIFKANWSPVTAPLYALFEGLALGAISAIYDAKFDGIVLQAVMLTMATLFALLMAYRSGLIRATENFKLGVVAATGGIALIYLASILGNATGWFQVPYLHDSGPIGIGISVVVIIVAALNLVLDFDFIESGAEARAPKYMEWYGAFGLMLTLVWLYLEFLRLLSKLRD